MNVAIRVGSELRPILERAIDPPAWWRIAGPGLGPAQQEAWSRMPTVGL